MESDFKITFIGTLPPIKGISPYCKELLTSLSKHAIVEFIGFKKIYPDFLYPGGKSAEDVIAGSSVTYENIVIRNTLTYYNPFSWIIAGLTCKGGIIHAQWWSHVLAPAYITILLLCKARRKKIVITIHNVLPHEASKMNTILNGLVLHLGDHFIVHSEQNIAELQTVFRTPIESISRVPHGILTDYCKINLSQNDTRRELELPIDKTILLFFGHIREYKGLDILLKALCQIVEKRPDVLLVIAGTPWKGWEQYELLIRKYNLEKHVKTYLNFIPSNKTAYYYNSADLVILPYKEFSSQSGVGSVALAFGKPLIVTDVGGLPEFVKDRRAIVQPNNSKELAERLLSIIEDKTLQEKLSADSRALGKEYSWENVANKTLEVYRDLYD
ncbi:MAG: glycosyltransferase family 4 protein [Bacteroidales bacterium]|nr:glycosyltransferase family 4 protein [Bacteroidales bacterium]